MTPDVWGTQIHSAATATARFVAAYCWLRPHLAPARMGGLATGLPEAGGTRRISAEAVKIAANDRNSVSRCRADRILVRLCGRSFVSGSNVRF